MGWQVDRTLAMPIRDERFDAVDVGEGQIICGYAGSQCSLPEHSCAHRSGEALQGRHVEGEASLDLDQQVRHGVVSQGVKGIGVIAQQSGRPSQAVHDIVAQRFGESWQRFTADSYARERRIDIVRVLPRGVTVEAGAHHGARHVEQWTAP